MLLIFAMGRRPIFLRLLDYADFSVLAYELDLASTPPRKGNEPEYSAGVPLV